jgi:choline dehydrogenase-like flavoprotein
MEFIRQKSVEILQAAGATTVWSNPIEDARGTPHARGTCRMGNDPKSSVVDKYHSAHDVPNLFIVDGSNFVTGGRNHPAFTIQALAFRAADHLVKAARNGSV